MKGAFRNRSALSLHEAHFGPNMTPMVDIVMVILIFFMASAAIVGPEWLLKTALPTARPMVSEEDLKRIEVRLVRAPSGATVGVIGEQRDIAIDALLVILRTEAAGGSAARLAVVIRPSKDARWEDVVRVHEWCERLGIARVGLLDPPGEDLAPAP
jgi:biopolymer transport protein ExbD